MGEFAAEHGFVNLLCEWHFTGVEQVKLYTDRGKCHILYLEMDYKRYIENRFS